MYDDFILSDSLVVTTVTRRGGYFSPPVQRPILAFTVSFYANSAAGEPDTSQKLHQTVAQANAGETFVGANQVVRVYDYRLTLDQPFKASSGAKYWLSIVPTIAGTAPLWGWATSATGDGITYGDFNGRRSRYHADLAFSLETLNAPILSIQRTNSAVLISWPVALTSYILQESPTLGALGWNDSKSPITVVDGKQVILSLPMNVMRFYRLRSP